MRCSRPGWASSSYAMLEAAELLDPADVEIAAAEEATVLAVERFMRLAGGNMPASGAVEAHR